MNGFGGVDLNATMVMTTNAAGQTVVTVTLTLPSGSAFDSEWQHQPGVDAQRECHEHRWRRFGHHGREPVGRAEEELLTWPIVLTTRREDGAILVLALVFMIIIALVLLGVVTLSGNGLRKTSHLLDQQSLEYRTNGAMQVAIQTVRYTNTAFPSLPPPPTSCLSSATGIQVGQNSPLVYVDCSDIPP